MILVDDSTGLTVDSLTVLLTDSEVRQLAAALEYVKSNMASHEHAMGDAHGGRRVEITVGGYTPGQVAGLALDSEALSAAILAEAARDCV